VSSPGIPLLERALIRIFLSGVEAEFVVGDSGGR